MDIGSLGGFDSFNIQTSGMQLQSATRDLEAGINSEDQEKLKKSCRDFESLLLNEMLKQMRKTVQESEFLPKSDSRKMFEQMLDEEISKEMAHGGAGTGLGEMLYQQLSDRQNLNERPDYLNHSFSILDQGNKPLPLHKEITDE